MAPNGTNASNLITMVTSYPEALGKGGGGYFLYGGKYRPNVYFFTRFRSLPFSQVKVSLNFFFPIVPYPRVPMVLQMDGSSQILFLLDTNIFSTTILFTHVMIHEKAICTCTIIYY